MVQKPFYEKGEGAILPSADGPYAVAKVQDSHGVILEDPLTGESAFGGGRVATERLVRFAFPERWAALDSEPAANRLSLRPGNHVAVHTTLGRQAPRVVVAEVK